MSSAAITSASRAKRRTSSWSGAVARSTKSGEDSSLAAFYLISMALGVMIISVHGSSVDLLHVLFGSALALNDPALWLLGGVTSLTLVLLALLYRPLVMECLDPDFLGLPMKLTLERTVS